ncbi:5-hydroxytryptamine receptor 1 [Amphibalanus amphitrite]|uniref:5-hydroxytryptamine receptor 1 n=1 Tax=Amphibalanus amphitrite TaxID=1232801 RepID=A0A6A4WEU8_AMPAM|nr:5-hydroxytryptamine receptor 1 [Amphibalanus amphitrite]KAF0304523.1 5-hydroxytryptamine receptor 1 [Amphibalanus amphitrite]
MEENHSAITTAAMDSPGYPWEVKLTLLVVLPLLILWTVVGNLLVCVAVCLVPRIRSQPYTVLYVSLAVADLFVAVLVMPMALLYLWAGTWRFGRTLCDVFVCADVLSCTASILNLCAISVDRYQAITNPLRYSQRRVDKLMAAYIGVVWGGAVCISIIPIAIIGNEHGNDDACAVSQNLYYQVWATLMSFYLPLAVMIFVYFKILRAARIIVRQERRAQGHLAQRAAVLQRGSHGSQELQLCTVVTQHETPAAKQRPRLRCPWSLSVPREKKASVTLGIIMTAFIVCWLPFFILAVLRPMVPRGSIPDSVSDVFLWLGYCNSSLNPVIYATFNKDFRRPFREILCLRCRSLKPLLRQEQYQEQYGNSQVSCSQAIQLPLVVYPTEPTGEDSSILTGMSPSPGARSTGRDTTWLTAERTTSGGHWGNGVNHESTL